MLSPHNSRRISFSELQAGGDFAKLSPETLQKVSAFADGVLDHSLPLTQRLETFHAGSREVLAANGTEEYPVGKRERTLAAYLTLRDPGRYTFYLDAARADVQRFTGLQVGEGYVGWTALVEALAAQLQTNADFAATYRVALTTDDYPDPSFRQVAADLLYTCTRRSALGRIDPLQHIAVPSQIAKLSMSAKNLSDVAYRGARRRSVVFVHRATKALASSIDTQAEAFAQASRRSWFYLCRGNEHVDMLGCFTTDDAVPAADPALAEQGWLERPYMLIGYPAVYAPYTGTQKWWTPNHNSTFTVIPSHSYAEAGRLVFEPYFRQDLMRSLAHGRPSDPSWIPFFQALATRLLDFRNDRPSLLQHLADVQQKTGLLNLDNDKQADGAIGPVDDVDPFTVFAQFNRGLTYKKRTAVAAAFAKTFGIDALVPDDFDGIPRVNNQGTWFFAHARTRGPEDIEALWAIFAKALDLADLGDADLETRTAFADAFDIALSVRQVRWNLTLGLFWIRPLAFPSLDVNTRDYLTQIIHQAVPLDGPGGAIGGLSYLKLRDELLQRFEQGDAPIRSFPELVAAAERGLPDDVAEPPTAAYTTTMTYPLNQILYGPPGTGKTYATRQMACEICDGKAYDGVDRDEVHRRYGVLVDQGRIAFTTFHPSLSYEDFVEGIKPSTSGEGEVSYEIEDGILKRLARIAQTPNGNSLEEAMNLLVTQLSDDEEHQFQVRGNTFILKLNGAGNLENLSLPSRTKRTILWNRVRARAFNPEPHFHQAFQQRVLDLLQEGFGYSSNAAVSPHPPGLTHYSADCQSASYTSTPAS